MGDTVTIVSKAFESGFVIIDQNDFNPAEHTLYVPKDAPLTATSKKASASGELAAEGLKKMRKDDLIALAVSKGLDIVPDEVSKQQIVDLILENDGE